MVAYGGIEVNTEQIIDALWYEADGDMAHSALSTTLNRLRKLIGIKDIIQLQDGKVSLNQNYCRIDTWAFERTLNEAETLWKKGEEKKTKRTEKKRTAKTKKRLIIFLQYVTFGVFGNGKLHKTAIKNTITSTLVII